MSERVIFTEFEWKYHCFWNRKTGEWNLNILLFNYWNDFPEAHYKHTFWKLVHTCHWNEPAEVSERVAFTAFEWKYHCFRNIKMGEWYLPLLLFNYWNSPGLGSIETYFLEFCAYVSLKMWNDLALGSLQTYFLVVGAYVSLKRTTTGVW